jgi:hypothetical protein
MCLECCAPHSALNVLLYTAPFSILLLQLNVLQDEILDLFERLFIHEGTRGGGGMLSKVLEFEETHNGANQLRSIAGGEKKRRHTWDK